MAGMYVSRPPFDDGHTTRDLNQGDLLADILVPAVVTPLCVTRQQGNKVLDPHREPIHQVRGDLRDLRVVLRVRLGQFCIVLSNACDNAQGYDLVLAPVEPFVLTGDNATHWKQISIAATGSANPKVFYLPASPERGLRRSNAHLSKIFVVSQEYLQRCIQGGTRRIGGLTSDGQRHLQWAIATWFSRNPREDMDWPSTEDLELKLQWLNAEIERGSRFQEDYRQQCVEIEAELAMRAAKQ